MNGRRLRILHAIHDFLPRHRAGSEIYAATLATAQSAAHDVFVLAAEYDPAALHGSLRWREWEGLTVVELVNNWEFPTIDEATASRRVTEQIGRVLEATKPDVVHVHSLLNLSFDLPRLARARGARVVATLHDYTLQCPSGGQRLHLAEQHRCDEIDFRRCARCFAASPFASQMAAGAITSSLAGRLAGRAGVALRRMLPVSAGRLSRALPRPTFPVGAFEDRMTRARDAFAAFDVVVAPSHALAQEFVRLGFVAPAITVSDYGFDLCRPVLRPPRAAGPVRIGYAGSIVPHKGVHRLLEAARLLRGAFTMTIAGSLEVAPEYVSRLRRQAEGLPVSFSGGYDASQAGCIYAGLDVLTVPSLWLENSPLVIHEAFVHGVAVVGSRIGGIPDLITDGINGFTCEPDSAPALAAALQRFVDDPPLAQRLAAQAPAVKTIDHDAREWEQRYLGAPAQPSART